MWYDQGRLQPSAVTSLILLTDHSVVDSQDERRVIETEAKGGRWSLKTSSILAGGLVLFSLLLLAGASRDRRGPSKSLSGATLRRESVRVLEALADETFRTVAGRRGAGLEWQQLADNLVSARLAEARSQRKNASAGYRLARDTARRLSETFRPSSGAGVPVSPNDEAIRETLAMAERIASQKVIEYDQD